MNRHARVSWRLQAASALLLCAVHWTILPASAQTTITWTGSVSADWNNPTNWTPQQVPTASDHVIINSGSVTIPANGVFAIMDWSGGTISGTLNVASNGVLNVNDVNDSRIVMYAALTNAGTVEWTGTAEILLEQPFYNLAGGVFEIQSDAVLDGASGNFLSNAGLVLKSVTTGATTLDLAVTNNGAVEADTGTILFENSYSETSSANLSISLGGSTPGSGYGQIQFANPPAFLGSFSVSAQNGFQPSPGETFAVLSYPSSTGAFSCMSLDLGGGILLQPQFSDTGLTLTATTYVTSGSQPQLFISASANSITLQWPLGFPGWTLQSTTNLAARVWTPVSVACGNQAVVPVAAAQQYFRLRNGN